MNPTATTPKNGHVLRDMTSASSWDFAPWRTLATSETTGQLDRATGSQCHVLRDTAEEAHFVFLAASAFEMDALDAAEGGCPTPQRCAATGCRGLCLPPSAA